MLTFLVKKDILYIPLYHYEGKSCYYDKVEHLEAYPGLIGRGIFVF